jgi:hypothetical protein
VPIAINRLARRARAEEQRGKVRTARSNTDTEGIKTLAEVLEGGGEVELIAAHWWPPLATDTRRIGRARVWGFSIRPDRVRLPARSFCFLAREIRIGGSRVSAIVDQSVQSVLG